MKIKRLLLFTILGFSTFCSGDLSAQIFGLEFGIGRSIYLNKNVTSFLGSFIGKVEVTERIALASAVSVASTADPNGVFDDEKSVYIQTMANAQYFFPIGPRARLYPLAGFIWSRVMADDKPSGFGMTVGGGIEFVGGNKGGFELRYSTGALTGYHLLYSIRFW